MYKTTCLYFVIERDLRIDCSKTRFRAANKLGYTQDLSSQE